MLRLFQGGDRISYSGTYSQTINQTCSDVVDSTASGSIEFTDQYNATTFGTEDVTIPALQQTRTLFVDGQFDETITTVFEQENNGTLNLLVDEFENGPYINSLEDFVSGNRFPLILSPLETGAIWNDQQEFLTQTGRRALYSIEAQVFSAERLSTQFGTIDGFRVVVSVEIESLERIPDFAPYVSRLEWRIAPSVGIVSGAERFGTPGLCGALIIPAAETSVSYVATEKSF